MTSVNIHRENKRYHLKSMNAKQSRIFRIQPQSGYVFASKTSTVKRNLIGQLFLCLHMFIQLPSWPRKLWKVP